MSLIQPNDGGIYRSITFLASFVLTDLFIAVGFAVCGGHSALFFTFDIMDG
jgi:hypothetical protein